MNKEELIKHIEEILEKAKREIIDRDIRGCGIIITNGRSDLTIF